MQVSSPAFGPVVFPSAGISRAIGKDAGSEAFLLPIDKVPLVPFATFLGQGSSSFPFAFVVLAEVPISVLEDVESPEVVFSVFEMSFVTFARDEFINAVSLPFAVDVVAPEAISVRKHEGTQTMSFTVLEASDVLSSLGIGHGAKDGGRGIFIQSQVLTRLIEARQHFVQRVPLFGFAKRLYLSTFGPCIVLFSEFDDRLDLRLDTFGLRSSFFLGAAVDEACNGNQA